MQEIYEKALEGQPLSRKEALKLYLEAPLGELCALADRRRREMVEDPEVVTWQIDRNVNITNVCISGCRFCNFHVKPHQKELHFITTREEYYQKIEETFRFGGDQLLLQGGLHPNLGIDFYEELFRDLKEHYPTLRLNALGSRHAARCRCRDSRSGGATPTLSRQALGGGVAEGDARGPLVGDPLDRYDDVWPHREPRTTR